ncbi:hypothetical protein EJ05DRAFT_517224 [Pseudovirgaria hyperparasitica]|uniref:BTB domain-containing protein n=1 Tax=Pseudovirgaria hyperparasitica TaxID=470096 RepID=A0A6A6W4H5_9PEZI|nr:uncharacterized protein EJ05DRAFT_517224 [Pseudovirgaria hyperparasitica]KAF2756866.1 hypothetical protein EJ05DRAFT_517224 [Pseudovirgaria hyperparasitica]
MSSKGVVKYDRYNDRVKERPTLSLDNNMITIKLYSSHDEKSFQEEHVVHETIFREASMVVDNAMAYDWANKRERVVKLYDMESYIAFQVFKTWVYRHKIIVERCYDTGVSSSSEIRLLLAAHHFGDKYKAIHFMDTVFDAITKLHEGIYRDPQLGLIPSVWARTMTNSPLRRYFIDCIVHSKASAYNPFELLKKLPEEFPTELAKAFMVAKFWPMGQGMPGDPCAYHVHVKGTCYKSLA